MISRRMAILKIAAILKKMQPFESKNIKFEFLVPKNIRNVLLHDHLWREGEFCAIFYFSFILAAILAAILDFFKRLSTNWFCEK